MLEPVAGILDVLEAYGIRPIEDNHEDIDPPEIGQIDEGETVYSTSIDEVLGTQDSEYADRPIGPGFEDDDDPRIREWWSDIKAIVKDSRGSIVVGARRKLLGDGITKPEPHCAWYCPIHFYGRSWGIYIREECILSASIDIATHVDWHAVRVSNAEIGRQLLLSAFYVFFLHEQFHHKVESLGFRLLIATGRDRYRPYKSQVYRPTYLTSKCLEEALANAESFRRLSESRYVKRIDKAIRAGLRRYLRASIPMQPPGYAEGIHYLTDVAYKDGLFELQSQVLDAVIPTKTSISHWSVAPNMITALTDITDDIFVVLPKGARPIFRSTSLDPGTTVSSRELEQALIKYYGYRQTAGGKGSHVKLAKPGARPIIIPGNRPVLSPGVVKHALEAIGGHPISKLPDILRGQLQPIG